MRSGGRGSRAVDVAFAIVAFSLGPASVGVLNTVHAAPRIMYMRAFASLFAGRPSGLHVRNIILAAPRFNALIEDLNSTIAEDFAAAREYVRVFEAVRMIHDHQLAWDKAAYESEVGFDARRVRLDLRKFRGWKAELDRMKVSQVRSHLLDSGHNLKNSLSIGLRLC